MSDIAVASSPGRNLAVLDRVTVAALLLLPLLLLHAHGIAEGAIAILDICFLARSAITRDWVWIKTPWLLIGWAWWGWLLICSLPIPVLYLGEGGMRSLIQAIVLVRFLVFVAALEHAILRSSDTRRRLSWVVTACAAYIGLHAIFQFITGYNFYGEPRGSNGVLSGPFGKPRAGAPFVRILLPAIIPWASALLSRPGVRALTEGWSVLIGGAAIAFLIGQRMPFLLFCLGLAVVGALLPRLRWGVAAAALALVALLVASPVVAPKTHYLLVEKFTNQLEHFSTDQYGELYARAIEASIQNPITGLGAQGFLAGCVDPRYFRPTFDGSLPDGGGARICWDHPHNYYLEALVSGGFPGLVLFCALCMAWLAALGRGLWRQPDPLRVALLAAAAIQLWPIAGTTGFTAMPVGGWSFLLLGWGLAEARWPNRRGDPI
jgi:O-antigen ligase